MNNPLYNRVQKIAQNKAVNGKISHKEFSGIRNRSSVKAILKDMGYHANCETYPVVWSVKRVAASYDDVIDRQAREMPSATSQAVLDQLKETGIYHKTDFKKSEVYLRNIIALIRVLGYEVIGVKDGKHVPTYTLDNKKPVTK